MTPEAEHTLDLVKALQRAEEEFRMGTLLEGMYYLNSALSLNATHPLGRNQEICDLLGAAFKECNEDSDPDIILSFITRALQSIHDAPAFQAPKGCFGEIEKFWNEGSYPTDVYDALIQVDEDTATLSCGCRLFRPYGDESVGIKFCQHHHFNFDL